MLLECIKKHAEPSEKMYPACFILCDNNCGTESAIIQLIIPSLLRK